MKICHLAISILTASAVFIAGSASAATKTFTTDADFDLGTLDTVNHDAPNSDQLQLNATGDTFPVLWIANAGEDTMSRINTDGGPPTRSAGHGCEEARYLTDFGLPTSLDNHGAFSGAAPSRTAVDTTGNVYVANRNFNNGRAPELIKIAVEGGVDRNNDGVITTSIDTNGDCVITPDEMLPVIDHTTKGTPGVLDIEDFQDERVIWISSFGGAGHLGRSLCLDTTGNLWAGTYNGLRAYYKFDQAGNMLLGPITTSTTNYGCAVDASGRLWGANLGTSLVELDTITGTHTMNHPSQSNYGIVLGNDRVYLGSILQGFNPATSTFQASIAFGGFGVSVDGSGAVWYGNSSPLRKFVTEVSGDLNPTPVCSVTTLGDRGPIIGKGNHVWTINLDENSISQYDNDCNFISTIPVGRSPYTYSDATGFGARNQTDPLGIWTVIDDGGAIGTKWDSVSWNNEPQGIIPVGASINIDVRVADTIAGLGSAIYASVTNGGVGLAKLGRFIQVRATLREGNNNASPVLSDVVLKTASTLVCDVEPDGDIDKMDLRVISLARGQQALPNDPRDANGDGVITPSDTKVCIPLCTLARCAVQ